MRASKGKHRLAYDADTVLVRFRDGVGKRARAAVVDATGGRLAGAVRGTDFSRVRIERGLPPVLATRLRRDPRVVEAVPNFIRRAQDDPNDAGWWPHQATLDAVRLPEAWSTTHGSSAIKIAIVDTGIDLDHPDLAPRVLPGWDFVNGDDSAYDDAGHGTMVAGIAAATPNNGFGIAGAAWNASVIPVKVLDSSGQGTDANVASGISWAADHGANVINLSLGGPADSPVLQQAVQYALSRDVLVVAAAGNAASSDPSYPAAYDGVVSVASTNDVGESSWFSNHAPWVDLAAPGEQISSTYPGTAGTDRYATGSGTSFSSPLVSGIGALVRAANPAWTQAQVASRLYATARDLGPRGLDDSYGHGLVDAAAALGATPQPALPPPRDSFEPNGMPDEAKPIGGGVSATISPENDVDWFYVDVATAGAWLTFTVTPPSGNFDPVLQAYTSDLRLLTSADRLGGGGAERLVIPANVPGRYYLRVANYAGSRTTTVSSTVGSGTASYSVGVAQTAAPSSRFAPYEVYPVGSIAPSGASLTTWPQWVAIGDLTGDGRNDVVLTTGFYIDPENDNRVFVFPQLDDGSLGRPTRIDPGCVGPTAEVGDLNADGKADLAVACGSAGMKIYYQSGGRLGPPTTLASPQAQSFRIADVDRDGRNDLVTQGYDGIDVALNRGTGFATTTIGSVRGPIRAGDVTGDGRIDVVVFEVDSDRVFVYPQNADGSFGAPSIYTAPSDGGWTGGGLEVGDVTGDGRADVAVTIGANSPHSLVDVFPQTAAGTLGTPATYSVLDIPEPLAAADLDRDGRNDLVTVHGGWTHAGLLLQSPTGTLGPEELYSIPYATNYPNVAVGDINDDGDPDIVLPDYNSGLIVLRQYSRNLPPRQQLWVRATSPSDFTAGVATTAAPTVRFARPLDAGSVTGTTVMLRDGESDVTVPASLAYDAGSQTVTIRPSSTLAAGKPYIVVVSGVRDTSGGVMAERFSFRFTTGSAADTFPPETSIWNGSEGTMSSSGLSFSFASEEVGATFSCSLNGAAFTACTSPAVYSVAPGTYTFRVRARDSAGNVDPSPARRRVVIVPVGQSPPETWFAGTTWPNGNVPSTNATFSLGSDATGATFECALDGAAYSACANPATYGGLAPGVHTFSARAVSNGLVDPTPLAVAWTVVTDTTPPDTAIDSGPSGATASRSASFTFRSTEAGSRFECSLDDAAFAACTSPASYSGLADGSHSFRVRAVDAGGNVDPSPAARTWTVDATPPQTTIDSGPTGTVGIRSASFAFSSSETDSRFECSLDAAAFTPCTSPEIYGALADGAHAFSVRAIDAAGNVDPTPAVRGWTVDVTDHVAPSVSLTSPDSGALARGTITLAATAEDDTAVDHVDFLVNGAVVGAASAAPYELAWDTRAVSDGPVTVAARAVDGAGNDATATAVITVDNTAPETAVLSGPPPLTNARTATIVFIADDAVRFECSLDGVAFAACTSPASYGGIRDGEHGFRVRAIDAAGNVDPSPAVRTWTADGTPPETRIDSGPTGTVASGSATFAFGSSEAGSRFECSLDGAAFGACSSPVGYTNLGAGSHAFLVRATDPAGNVDATPASAGWSVDLGGVVQPPPVLCRVPALKRKTLPAAKRLLTRAHCRLRSVRRAYSRVMPKGRIVAQTPRAGTRLPNHGRVSVTVSRGRRR